jgi:hypothetical protein
VVALALVPRHTPLQAIIVLAILPLALRFAWYSDRGPKDKPDERMKRSRMAWAAGGVGLMLWEFAANIFGQLDGSLHSFPTISVLIDPILDNIFGQAVFVVLWLLIGVTFLKIWKKP